MGVSFKRPQKPRWPYLVVFMLIILAGAFYMIRPVTLPDKPLEIGDAIPSFLPYTDQSGNTASLLLISKQTPVILVYYHTDSCSDCQTYLTDLLAIRQRIEQAGYQLITVDAIKTDYSPFFPVLDVPFISLMIINQQGKLTFMHTSQDDHTSLLSQPALLGLL